MDDCKHRFTHWEPYSEQLEIKPGVYKDELFYRNICNICGEPTGSECWYMPDDSNTKDNTVRANV